MEALRRNSKSTTAVGGGDILGCFEVNKQPESDC